MVRKFLYSLLARRHFWRYATFSEVAEIYLSRMLRMAAIYIMGSFVSIYLYQIGYSVTFIAFAWAAFYGFKAVTALTLARLVAWVGPKHGTLISNILYIPSMIGLALLPQYGEWLLVPALAFQAISAAMYSIAYNINFSKVKSLEHAGKEIAYMNIFEKVTTGLSPLIGGFVALLFGPQVVIIIAAILFAAAAAPLFKTGEPVKVNQKLTFRGFPWRLFFRHFWAQFSYGFDVFSSGTAWTLYVAISIVGISAASNGAYAVIGMLVSVVFVVAIIASYTYGKIIDKRRGRELMRMGAVANAVTHLMRPFVSSTVVVAGLNAANELATTAYTLPYTRAVFDNADISGVRTTYLGAVEAVSNLGAFVAAALLGAATFFLSQEASLRNFFFISAAVALLVLTARFPLYKK